MTEMRILVVDDHKAHAEGLAELLSIRGYAAWYVADAETALADLDKLHVDVILSDVNLSGMSGYELCRRVRATPKFDHVAFIFHTASEDISGKLHGGDAFLTYPIGIGDLTTVITGCVARRTPERMLDTVCLFAGAA